MIFMFSPFFCFVLCGIDVSGSMWRVFPIVFDTTLTNSGEYEGVCAHLSSWIGEEGKGDLLWCACRKHISELRMKWFCSKFLGDTKEPGVKLFRRFQTDFLEIEKIIKEEDLVRLNLSLFQIG